MWDGVGLGIGSSVVGLSVFPVADLISTLKKHRNKPLKHPLITKAKCWYFFRLKEGDDYVVCGTFASLKYSPQEKDLKSSVVQNAWSHPDIWAAFFGQFFILPGHSTHFSVAFPPFLTATTVNNVATNSKPGHSRSSKWVKQSVRDRNACGKWPFLMALASARQEGSVGMVRNWSVLWEGASRTCHVGMGILGN